MGGWRIRRAMKLAPGVKINLTGSGVGLSIGPRGAKLGLSTSKGAYVHQSIPSTGIYKRTYLGKGGDSTPPKDELRQSSARSWLFGFLKRLFAPLPATGTKTVDNSRAKVFSAFLVTQHDLFASFADSDGLIARSDQWPAWLAELQREVQASDGQSAIFADPEWHGFSAKMPGTLPGRCLAITPVKQLITKWAEALRRYKTLQMQDVEVALRPTISIVGGFQSATRRFPETYTGVILVGEDTIHSTETFVLCNDLRAGGIYEVSVGINFNLNDIGLGLARPFTYLVIREDDELRYTFRGGMR